MHTHQLLRQPLGRAGIGWPHAMLATAEHADPLDGARLGHSLRHACQALSTHSDRAADIA